MLLLSLWLFLQLWFSTLTAISPSEWESLPLFGGEHLSIPTAHNPVDNSVSHHALLHAAMDGSSKNNELHIHEDPNEDIHPLTRLLRKEIELDDYATSSVYNSAVMDELFNKTYFPVSSYVALSGESSLALYGTSVVMGNDFAVVGSPGTQVFQGAIYVYRVIGQNTWVKIARIDAPVQDYTAFGCALAAHGDDIIVGANAFDSYIGQAYYYKRTSVTSWAYNQTFVSPLTTSVGFGFSVALTEGIAAVGTSTGELVTLYKFQRGKWSLMQKLQSPVHAGLFGYSIALNQKWLVVGANEYNNTLGSVFVYHLNTTSLKFIYSSEMKPLAGLGTYFGVSVAINSNSTIAIGATGYNLAVSDVVDGYSSSIAPTMYPTISPTVRPTVLPTLAPTSARPSVEPTYAPSMQPSEAPTQSPSVVPSVAPSFSPSIVPTSSRRRLQSTSAPTASMKTSGWVYVYDYAESSNPSWKLTQILESPTGAYSHFGFSVSLSDDVMMVGAPGFPGTSQIGAAFGYSKSSSNGDWSLNRTYPAPSSTSYRNLGVAVGVSPDGKRGLLGADLSLGYTGSVLSVVFTNPHGTFAPTFAPTAPPILFIPTTAPTLAPTFVQSIAPTQASNSNQNGISVAQTRKSQVVMIVFVAIASLFFLGLLILLCWMCCCAAPPVVAAGKKKKKEEEEEEESPALVVGPWSRPASYYPQYYYPPYYPYPPQQQFFFYPPQPAPVDDKEKEKMKKENGDFIEKRIGGGFSSFRGPLPLDAMGNVDYSQMVGAYHVNGKSAASAKEREKEKQKDGQQDVQGDDQSAAGGASVRDQQRDVFVRSSFYGMHPRSYYSNPSYYGYGMAGQNPTMESHTLSRGNTGQSWNSSRSDEVMENWDDIQRNSFYQNEEERTKAMVHHGAGQDPAKRRMEISVGISRSNSSDTSDSSSSPDGQSSEVQKAKNKGRFVKEAFAKSPKHSDTSPASQGEGDAPASSPRTSTLIQQARQRAFEAMERARQRTVQPQPQQPTMPVPYGAYPASYGMYPMGAYPGMPVYPGMYQPYPMQESVSNEVDMSDQVVQTTSAGSGDSTSASSIEADDEGSSLDENSLSNHISQAIELAKRARNRAEHRQRILSSMALSVNSTDTPEPSVAASEETDRSRKVRFDSVAVKVVDEIPEEEEEENDHHQHHHHVVEHHHYHVVRHQEHNHNDEDRDEINQVQH